MKTLALSLLSATTVALIAIPAQSQEAGPGVVFKQKLDVGKTYQYRQDMEMTMALPIGGAGESKTQMSMDVSMGVAAAPEGDNKIVTTKFDRIKMEMDVAGQKMIYDSTDKTKQNPLLKTAFGELGAKSFKAIYDKNDRFVKMAEDGSGGSALAGMGMGEKEIEQMLKQLTDYGFPARPLKPGEKWDHTQNASMGQMGEMEMDMQFTYKGPTEREGVKVEEIEFTGTVGGKAQEAGEELVSFKDSKMSGKMYFDTALGTIRHSEVDMNLTMAVGGAGGAEMDTSTRSTYSLIGIE